MIITLLKGCYPYFSSIAMVVILWRIRTKRWTVQETIIAAALALHMFLEIMQMLVGDGKWGMHRRYLLPVAPLFFVWTAYGVIESYRSFRSQLSKNKSFLFLIAAIFTALCLYDGMRPSLCHRFSNKKGIEAEVAHIAGNFIRMDYRGPANQSATKHPEMYHSPFLPTVHSPFPAVVLFCGGRAEPSPFCDPPDYWVLPENAPVPERSEEKYRIKAGKRQFVIYKRISE